MRLTLAVCLALAALAGGVPGSLAAQNQLLKGTVVDSSGAPVGRPDVGLPELGRRTLSDADGQVTLGQVPPGPIPPRRGQSGISAVPQANPRSPDRAGRASAPS